MDRHGLDRAVNELSDDEVMQAPREMSDDEVMGRPAPAVAPPPIPEPFLDRVRAGQALRQAAEKALPGAKAGLDLLNAKEPNGERFQFFPERMIRSGFSLAHDVMNGQVLTGPGLRREDLSDDPDAPQPLDTLIQRSQDMAGFQLGQTAFERALVDTGEGGVSRLYSDENGTMRGQPVGTLPQEADFKTGAAAVTEHIAAAAVKVDGKIFAGAIHSDAFEAASKALGREVENHGEGGFLTSSGRYVSRKEALKIAESAEQIPARARTDEASYELSAENLATPNTRVAEQNLRELWEQRGIHPAEAVHDAQTDAFLKQDLRTPETDPAAKLPAEAWSPEELADRPYSLPPESEGKPASLGAAAAGETPSLAQQPPPAPGRLSAAIKDGTDKLFDIGRDLQMMTAPMATGSRESQAIAKDFMNSMRRNRWEWSRMDSETAKNFTPEQRKRMWDAADEESVARQLGESREHQGLVTLTPEERAHVEMLQARAQNAWLRAVDLGMVEGDGLPAYTPRMIINAASATGKDVALPLNGIGGNLRTRTAQMMRRQHMTAEETEAAAKAALGDTAEIARDIRALPLATAKLEDAIAGRTLIDAIKEYGKRTGEETLSEGGKPAGSEHQWFTIDHPAFRTWKPKFEEVDGKVQAATDKDGNVIFQQVPIFVRGDFEGPLRAVLTQKSGALYGGLMSLKGKTMSLIMNSPLIHNAVEWGRAMPAMPGKVATFKIYFEGNRAKNNIPLMHEAIDAGLVPIGHRFFNQDISSIMEEPNLAPGRSWTAKVLGAVPGLFDEAAGNAVKSAIDKAGDFWHNTLLWDRVGDLQMGLYTNLKSSLTAKGIDNQSAARMAAHLANRYAGALPQEAMSDGARKISNMLLFSRSFTLGNLGVMKDMLTGLPKDVMAQIERDAGFRAGSINEAGELAGSPAAAVQYAKTMARRKAMAVVALDIGMMYVGNSILQSASNVLLGDSTLDKEMHGYVERLNAMLSETKEHPLKLLQPLALAESLSATTANEPGKADRVMIGTAKDGTAIYARNPVGKIGEEFTGYMTGPLDMLRRKLGTLARPAWQIAANDKGFGRKVYDPNADTPGKYLSNLGKIAAHIMGSQLPEGQISAFSDLVKGEGDWRVNAGQAFGPIAGVTFSKGAPGGPAVGEMYAARSQHDFAVQMAMPDIRKQILRGDLPGATQRMNELKIEPSYQKWIKQTTLDPATRLSPKTLKRFYDTATPEQIRRMQALPVR